MADSKTELHFHVAPRNGRASRLVIAEFGDRQFRDEINVDRANDRIRFAQAAAAYFEVPYNDILPLCHELPRLADEVDRQAEEAARTLDQQSNEAWEPSAEAMREAERLLKSPELLAAVVDAAHELGIVGERALVALTYLTATSRLLEKPLYLLIQGDSSSGKTTIARTVCTELLPPGVMLDATELTQNSLYYMRDNIQNRVLLLGERRRQIDDSAIDVTKSIRELTETGKITKLIPVKQTDGSFRTELFEVNGPVALIETASHDRIAAEDKTRQITAWTDESPEQTRRVIMEFARRRSDKPAAVDRHRLEAIRAVQTLLEPAPIVIPYLPRIADRFPANPVSARRAFVRLVGVTEASALLHQRQRERRNGAVVAEPDDFKLALELTRPWLDVMLGGGLSPTAREVWEIARRSGGPFTSDEIAKQIGRSRRRVQEALRSLIDCDAVRIVESGRGRKTIYEVAQPDWEPGGLHDLLD